MREPSTSRQPARTATALSQVSAALLFFLIVLPGFSQPQEFWQSPPRPNNQGDNQDTIKINVDLVVLHATVQNHKGIPVSGLGILTPVTCYPFNFMGSAPRRFIVRARRILE